MLRFFNLRKPLSIAFCKVFTPLRDAALVALWFAGYAGVATVQYKPMVRLRQKVRRDILLEL